MQLCSVRMTRWPLNDKPPEFHEDELLTRPHMKYIWAHLPRKVCLALCCASLTSLQSRVLSMWQIVRYLWLGELYSSPLQT